MTDNLRCLACRTPMGTADICPACGWSYAADPETELEPPEPPAAQEPAPAEPTPGPDQTAVPSQAGWGEVAAVLAVGVVPYLFAALPGPHYTAAPPFWAAAVHLIGSSACVSFVTLYLIRRSGEPWTRFGLARPAVSDVLLGIGMLFVAELVRLLGCCCSPPGNDYPSHAPRGPTEFILMVAMNAGTGFAEELVTRAYLITRLEVLLRSRGWAVFLAAAAFASYHAYQGLPGLVFAFLIGLAFGVAFLVIRRVWPLALGHALFDIHMDLLL